MKLSLRFILALVVFVLFVFFVPDEKKSVSGAGEMGIGTPDDPNGLLAYEKMRHADPATGEIPFGIRKRELAFAAGLPQHFSRSLNWELIGPRDLGGRTRAFAYDIRDENILLAGGVTGGIWRSTDGGQSFSRVSDVSQLHSVTCIVQDTRAGHEDTWYAGTGEYYGIVSGTSFTSRMSGDGLFKSTDNGLSWTSLSSTSSGTPQTLYANGDMDFVWRIVTGPLAGNDVLLAAVYNGVFRSADGGASWIPVLGFDSTTSATSDYSDVLVTPAGVYYAALSSDGPDKGIYRSTDGISWTAITGPLPPVYNRVAMAFNPSNENEIMLVMESPNYGLNDHSLFKYTYVSGNGSGSGGVWENRSANLPNGSCTGFFDFDFGYFQTQGGYDMHIAWHPDNDSILFIGGTNLYRTTNQFTNPAHDWIGGYQCNQSNLAQYVYPEHHPDQHGLVFLNSDPTKAISFSDGGLHRTEDILADSVIWSSLNNGYVTSQFYTVALEEGDVFNDFLIAGAQDNGVWFTNRNHLDSLWKWVYRGDGSYLGIPNGRPFWIFSIQQGKMYKMQMTDNGDTILGTRIDPTGAPSNYNFINSFTLDPSNTDRLYMVSRLKIWRNDSLSSIPVIGDIYNTISTGWTEISQSNIALSHGIITVTEISKNNPDRLYYGCSKSGVYRLDQAASASPVKTNITGSNFPVNAYVSSVGANPFNADELLVSFSNYNIPSIFYSQDAGTSWEDVSGNLEQFSDGSGDGPAVYWVTVYPGHPSPTYFAGTSVGLYSTTSLNGSSTIWTQEGAASIGRAVVNMIKSRTSDGKIVVATHGNGIYSASLPPVFLSAPELASEDFSFASFPNPFTEYCTIDVLLNEAGWFDINVYDLQGKKIRGIYSGSTEKGPKRLLWNRDDASGNKVATGTYLLICRINNKQLVRKLIVY